MSTTKRDNLFIPPAYPFVEAAHYLHVPYTTLRAWCLGHGPFRGVIRLDSGRSDSLSFLNVIEAHVLSAIPREHRISLPKVEDALSFVSKRLGLERPLADVRFATDGVDLFVKELSRIVNISRPGQMQMAHLILLHLERIERDANGIPMRLYPFTRRPAEKEAARSIVMDPSIAFGRPVLVGTAVPTNILAERFKAGDGLVDLARDFGAQTEVIEEALRCEFERRQAA